MPFIRSLSQAVSCSFRPLPAGPLRSGVEQVFRAFCEDITATGLQDMLEILLRPLGGGAEGSEDEDGMSIEQEEGEESDSDEDEEEEGELGRSFASRMLVETEH